MTRPSSLADLASIYDSQPISGMRNRIINGDMRIDQRNAGASVTVTSSSPYTVDRWVAGMVGANGTAQRVSSSVTGFTNQITLTGTSSTTTTWFGTRLESVNCSDLVGQTVTLSFWAASSNQTSILARLQHANTSDGFGNGGTVTLISSVNVAITSTMTRYTVVYTNLPAGAANGLYVEFVSGGSLGTGTMSFTGVQLEAGPFATPFERRSFGQELMLCQRYYQTGHAAAYGVTTGSGSFNPDVIGFTSFNTTMRATPTITRSNVTDTNGTASISPYPTGIKISFDITTSTVGGTQFDFAAAIEI